LDPNRSVKEKNMIKLTAITALVFALVAVGPTPGVEAAPVAKGDCTSHAMTGSAQWTRTAPDPCGPFSTLLVHSTQGDIDVVEVIYQAGDSCPGGTFLSVQGSGLVSVTGNLHRLTIRGAIPVGDGRTVAVDLTLITSKEADAKDKSNRTVDASARGTVILDGMELTGGVPTTDAFISRSKC
jgi:hypothetical protein